MATQEIWSHRVSVTVQDGAAEAVSARLGALPGPGAPASPPDDAALRALLAVIAEATTTQVGFSDHVDPELPARLLALASAAELDALWGKTPGLVHRWHLLDAMSDAQLTSRAPTTWPGNDAALRFERLRRGLYDEAQLTRDLAGVDGLLEHYGRLENVFTLPILGQGAQVGVRLRGLIDAARHAQPLVGTLRAWHAARRVKAGWLSNLESRDAMFLCGLVYDDDANAWMSEILNQSAADLRKSWRATKVVSALGDTFFLRDDGESALATLGKRVKVKAFAELLAQATARLTNHRSTCGLVIAAPIPFGLTTEEDALRLVREAGPDHFETAARGLDPADPVATLNAFRVALARELELPADARTPPERALAFLGRALHALDACYDASAPDGKALGKKLGGHQGAKTRFVERFRAYYEWTLADAPRVDFANRVLVPLYLNSRNHTVQDWIADFVASVRPDLATSTRFQFERFAAESLAEAKAKDAKATITLLFPGEAAPAEDAVNRLYGAPIGVDEARWPQVDGQPMAHLLTLETRFLAAEARAHYAAKGVVAIAVFLSKIDDHEAFAPGHAHAAVVELSAVDLTRGEGPAHAAHAGRALVPVTREVPEAVFRGGAKKSALAALRKVLDREDFLAPYRRTPRWLQGPEGEGLFLFDVSSDFAPALNMGDGGRLFVFAHTAFVQG
jgi:hypothetical protein